MKINISDIKNTLERIKSRLHETGAESAIWRQSRKKHPIRAKKEKRIKKNKDTSMILVITNNPAMNTGMFMLFLINILGPFGYIPRSGVTGSKADPFLIF